MDFLISLGETHYDLQRQAMALIAGKMKNKSRKLCHDEETLKMILNQRKQSLDKYRKAVITMMMEMGFDEGESKSLVDILCTDDNISEETRMALVDSWQCYKTLKNFNNDEEMFGPIKMGLLQKFKWLSMSLLPLKVAQEGLDLALADKSSHLEDSKLVDLMLDVAKVKPPSKNKEPARRSKTIHKIQQASAL